MSLKNILLEMLKGAGSILDFTGNLGELRGLYPTNTQYKGVEKDIEAFKRDAIAMRGDFERARNYQFRKVE